MAGLPRLPALTHVSFGDWRPTSPLLNSWGILVKQDFIKWVKEMGVLVVVRPHNSPGRHTRNTLLAFCNTIVSLNIRFMHD